MRDAFLKKMRTTLTRQKQQILRQLNDEIQEGKDNGHEDGMDTYDLATEERDREISLILGDRDWDKPQAIDNALHGTEETKYGLCEQCEEEIAQARLEILPFTRLCVTYQEELEKESSDGSAPRGSNAVNLDEG